MKTYLSGNYVTLSVTCSFLYFPVKLEFSSNSEDDYSLKLRIMYIKEYEKNCKKMSVYIHLETWRRISGKISDKLKSSPWTCGHIGIKLGTKHAI